jgi:hypothetical protein
MAFGDFTVDRNSTKYVLGSGGDIISYATDEPAFEFNADGSYKGLLVEPAATNICKQSEDINTTWGVGGGYATPTQSTEETPDGDTTNKYIKLVDDGSTGTGTAFVTQSITVSESTKYTASAFLKADGLAFAALRIQNYKLDSTDGIQYFGLSGAGSLGTADLLDDSSIEAYPNGWYRCSVTWTQGAGDTNVDFQIYVASSISSISVDLDGTSSIFVWGAQVETGPIATSYIPTTTASVTRNKDDINLGSASSLIGQTEGTLYIEVDWQYATGIGQTLLDLTDGTIDNRIFLYKNTSTPNQLRMYVEADDDAKTDQGVDSSGFSGIQKIALAYKTDDFELYRNGSSISSDTSGSLAALATLTDIDLGQTSSAGGQANMWIRSVALFTRRLSDAECQALTTL